MKLGEVLLYEQPTKYIVKSTNYSQNFKTPVLTAGQTFILGYTNETEGVYNASKDNPAIIFDDFTTSVKYVDFPFKVKSSAMKILTASNCNIKYMYYLLTTIKVNTELHKRYWISKYSNIEINLPSIDIQNEVVNQLDILQDIVFNKNQQLEQLDLLIKSRFVEMFGDVKTNKFGWVNIKLSKIITNINNGMTRRGNDIDGNIVLRLVELQNGYIDYSSTNRIKLQDDEKQKFLLKENDFLFARVNGNPDYVGRCAVFSDVGEPVYHNDHIIRVHCDDSKLNGTFGCYFFNSEYGKSQIREYITTSAGQYTINQTGISSMHIVLPPLTLQNEFAQFVEQVEKTKTQVQKSLDEAQLLFNSLMQEYFG